MDKDLHFEPGASSQKYPEVPANTKLAPDERRKLLQRFAWEFLRRDPDFRKDYAERADLLTNSDRQLVENDRELFAKSFRCYTSSDFDSESGPSQLADRELHPFLKDLPESAARRFNIVEPTGSEPPNRTWRLGPTVGQRHPGLGVISNEDRKKHWARAIEIMERRRVFPPDFQGRAPHDMKPYTRYPIRDELADMYGIASDPKDYHPSKPEPPEFRTAEYPFEPDSSPLEIDSSSEIALVFSLDTHIQDQVDRARDFLLEAAKVHEAKSFRAQMRQYIVYLKLLDAESRGDSKEQVFSILTKNGKIERTRTYLHDTLANAHALRDGGYIRLVGGHFSPPEL